MEKKTMIILGSSVIGFLLLVVFIVWLVSALKPKYYDYEEVEEKIKRATEKYYNDHIDTIQSDDGEYSLDYSLLVNGEYIKPLSDLLRDSNGCTAKTIIIKKGSDISYIPYLSCGEKYATKELYNKILEDNEKVTEKNGLYLGENGEYYFRGKIENNYVSFGKKIKSDKEIPIIWRIIGIRGSSVILKSQVAFDDRTEWDNRYNVTKERYVGYNLFETSIIKDFLLKMNDDTTFLSSEEKAKLNLQQLCIGARSVEDVSKNGATECSVKSEDEYYYRTMYPYEYLRSSLDDKCTSTNSISCSNLNYLSSLNINSEWLLTVNSINDYQAYIYDGSIITPVNASGEKRIYPVIELNKYAFIKSGNGTLDDPYLIR